VGVGRGQFLVDFFHAATVFAHLNGHASRQLVQMSQGLTGTLTFFAGGSRFAARVGAAQPASQDNTNQRHESGEGNVD
jgi:hypothetical protein